MRPDRTRSVGWRPGWSASRSGRARGAGCEAGRPNWRSAPARGPPGAPVEDHRGGLVRIAPHDRSREWDERDEIQLQDVERKSVARSTRARWPRFTALPTQYVPSTANESAK